MDLFGALVIAAVTAVGGGTVRDLILDRHPVFWVQDLRYLGVSAGAGGLTFAYTSFFRPPSQLLEVADALGLAVFSVVGARVALGVGAPPVVVVIMSATTATVGGMVRDVLCDETPLILRKQIYATAALAGGGGLPLAAGPLPPAGGGDRCHDWGCVGASARRSPMGPAPAVFPGRGRVSRRADEPVGG